MAAWAGETAVLVVPDTEDPAAWAGPAALGGFKLGSGATGGGAVVELRVEGAEWLVHARDAAGNTLQSPIAAPRDASEREDAVWLAGSLLRSLPEATPGTQAVPGPKTESAPAPPHAPPDPPQVAPPAQPGRMSGPPSRKPRSNAEAQHGLRASVPTDPAKSMSTPAPAAPAPPAAPPDPAPPDPAMATMPAGKTPPKETPPEETPPNELTAEVAPAPGVATADPTPTAEVAPQPPAAVALPPPASAHEPGPSAATVSHLPPIHPWVRGGASIAWRPATAVAGGFAIDGGVRIGHAWLGVGGSWLSPRDLPKLRGDARSSAASGRVGVAWSPPSGRLAPWVGGGAALSWRSYTDGAVAIDAFLVPVLAVEAGAAWRIGESVALSPVVRLEGDLAETVLQRGGGDTVSLSPWEIGLAVTLRATSR